MKKTFFILFTLLLFSYSFSQTYTMNNGANGKVTKCAGVFVDNGGIGSKYSSNQNSTITFCPTSPGDKIKISFTSFETQDLDNNNNPTDYLDVWYGSTIGTAGTQNESFSGNLAAFTITSTSPDGCISLKFTSNGTSTFPGWVANISCITPCTTPIAAMVNTTTVDVCPPSSTNPGSLSIPFDASTSTTASGNIVKYEWDWGDGTKSITSTAKTSHVFPNLGIFITKLRVRNDNTNVDPLGCQSTNSVTKTIRVMPSPIFTGSSASTVNIACGDSTTLVAAVTSQTISQQTPSVVSGTVSLPDGSGDSFTLGIDYAGFFPVGSTVTSGCYPTLKFNLEHSYAGDLSIDLISPSGQTVRVFTNDGIDNDNKFGTCANTNDDGVPGCGANYTVVNSGGFNWPSAGASGTTSATKTCASYTGSCGSGSYYKSQTYNSANPFSAFNGADLNGVWTIKITDNLKDDDGTLFSWSLDFPQTCYVSLATVTPNIATATWSHSGSGPVIPAQTTTSSVITNPGPGTCPSPGPCLGNKLTNSVSVGPFPTAGTFVYNSTAVDQFGCQYVNPVTVNVTCSSCPTATIKYAANSFCVSDTTAQIVTLTGTGAFLVGTYSSTLGLKIDPITGSITPNLSTEGIYTVKYTIATSGGCPAYTASTIVTINAIPAPPLFKIIQPSCALPTGTVTITGIIGETYSFDSGAYNTTLVYGGLVAGSSHTLQSKSVAGCISTVANITLNTPATAPAIPNVTLTEPTCQLATGTATITAIAGETYSFDSGAYSITLTYSGLAAGSSHTVFAKNAAGCISLAANITLKSQPALPSNPAITITQPTCTFATGTVTITQIAGETYSFDSGVHSSTLIYSGLIAGSSHTLTTKNTLGCISTVLNIPINTQPATPTAPIVALTQPDCGVATGSATITQAMGETYSFDSSAYSSTLTYSGLASGSSHTVKAKNTFGCISTATTIVISAQPKTPIVTATPKLKSICSGSATAIALSSTELGTTYIWNAIQTNVNGAVAGSGDTIAQVLTTVGNKSGEAVYAVTPTANSCRGTTLLVVVTVNPIPEASANPAQETICSGNAANITLTSNVVGTAFNWTAVQTDVLGAISGSGNIIAQSLRTAGKIQGKVEYTITPTINGCTGIPIIVTVTVDPSPEVFASSGTVICSGESSNITLSPNIPGTTFAWTTTQTGVIGATLGAGDVIDQILEADANLGTAVYTITPSLKDCVGKSIMITVNVNPAPSPAIAEGIICVDQVTNSTFKSHTLATGLNNTKHDFEWFLDGVLIDGAVASSYEATKVGNYSVIVTNTLTGCVSKEVLATVVANYPADNPFLTTVTDAFTQNGIITVMVEGGTGPFLYQLDMGAFQSDNVFTGASSGLHTVTVVDPQGCTNMSQKVTVIDYPKYFTPNGDGINDTWNIGALNDQPNAIVYIYDSYGKLIKQISTEGQGWDGTYNGKPLPSSDYWFTINYLETNTNKLFKAHFSLKR
ncbi:T9SS type B sorting domain-containing protein [Flavobacterium psychrotolerans]|nr:T9SS type B sorting domain-containing protein [Flavobacterium psychrotolerans]